MDFNTSIQTCLQNYFTFSGRARRSEFWWFTLCVAILMIFGQIIDDFVLGWRKTDTGPVEMVVSLAFFIPSLSVGWRRLHDTGRSGWWMGGGFLGLAAFTFVAMFGRSILGFSLLRILSLAAGLAFIAWLVMLVFFWCQDSQKFDNHYGPRTK